MSDEMGIFETMYNCRAMRKIKTDEVPEELLLKLVAAGDQAPSGSNLQRARWIVVRDRDQKSALAELNKKSVEAYIGPQAGRPASLPHQSAEKRQRMLSAVLWQAEHMAEIPALIIACMLFDEEPSDLDRARAGGVAWAAGPRMPGPSPALRRATCGRRSPTRYSKSISTSGSCSPIASSPGFRWSG